MARGREAGSIRASPLATTDEARGNLQVVGADCRLCMHPIPFGAPTLLFQVLSPLPILNLFLLLAPPQKGTEKQALRRGSQEEQKEGKKEEKERG